MKAKINDALSNAARFDFLVKASDDTSNTSSNTCLNSLADKCRA